MQLGLPWLFLKRNQLQLLPSQLSRLSSPLSSLSTNKDLLRLRPFRTQSQP